MSEPGSATKPKRGRPPRKTRKNELIDELAAGSEPLDSRSGGPSVSVQEDIVVYKVDPNQIVEPEIVEPDSDSEAQGTHRATPSMSQRVAHAAQTAKDAVQDTLTSAAEEVHDRLPFSWPALLGLLLLTLLAGYALSTLLRPHYKSDDLSYFSRSVDQANHKYKQIGDYVTKTENRLIETEHRLKDAVKQVLHLQSSHDESSSHNTRLQDQMHKLSDRVGQATHLLGSKSKKGWLSSSSSDSDSEESDDGYESSGLPHFIEEPIRRLIQQQLEIFAADKTGQPDWAIKYAGGRVLGHSKVYRTALPPFWDWTYWGCHFWPGCQAVLPSAAQALLTPEMAPGQCLPLDGTSGYVDIRLHHPIYLTGFSLEHIPAAIAFNVTSAPKVVSLSALTPPQTHLVKGGLFEPVKTYGPFRYDVNANSAVQTFSIFSETPEPVNFVRLQVHSNHGHTHFTCLYRIRVHGEPL